MPKSFTVTTDTILRKKSRLLLASVAIATSIGAAAGCNEHPINPTTPDAGGTVYDNDGGAGNGNPGATVFATRPSNGSAVAISQDDAVGVVVNREAGSVTVLALTYPAGAPAQATVVGEVSVGAASEPWQVVIAPDGNTAWVALRKDQKVVAIENLRTAPVAGASVAVGSEPTGIALTPSGRTLWVANWVDGTLTEIDAATMAKKGSVDLNAPLVATGYLGAPKLQKVALAHPRSLAITNDLDTDDGDETIYATEYYAQATEAEDPTGSNADTRRSGIVYAVSLRDHSVKTVRLAPLTDMGFKDEKGEKAGCFPNQLQAVTVNGPFAYVVSVCESPRGPTGPKVTTTACTPATIATDCAGLADPACVQLSATQPGTVCVDVASVKTTTAPVVSVIDTATNTEVAEATASLNAKFFAMYTDPDPNAPNRLPDNASRRFPLAASDIAFVPGTAVSYLSANGADAVFRVKYDGASGKIAETGSPVHGPFIDLNPKGISAANAGLNPIGIAIGTKGFALVANEVSRNAQLIDLNLQAVAAPPGAAGLATPSVVPTTAQPTGAALAALKGKALFNTGLGRWSLKGQAWGSCQSCHMDGLSDNVTWYFARGPRQSTSLDGTFNSKDPTDQRILNWTAIFDEIDDFELNTRGVSGGVGATVSALPAAGAAPLTADRIDIAGAGTANGNGNAGLNGSAAKAADPANPLKLDPGGKLASWDLIKNYVQTIRSPRGATGLDPAKVATGAGLFAETASPSGSPGLCMGCHGGPKWTLSKVFTPDINAAAMKGLNDTSWSALVTNAGFPTALLPACTPENQKMRFGGTKPAAFDQLLCTIRPVGTFNVAEPGAGIAELRVDMKTLAQGGGDADANFDGKGYNVPSLLGLTVGAPYFHGGNARTLEALLSDTFAAHTRALGTNFLLEADPTANVDAIIQYLLSIDEDTTPVSLPPLGAKGGDFCAVAY
jgi:hypothetical protein